MRSGISGTSHHLDAVMVIVAHTEVLLEVDGVLCDPQGVVHVGAHHLHALDTLRTGEPDTEEIEV